MDLGLALTHDALHFHEPIPGFRFILAREQPGSPTGVGPALMQGQGMENVGDRTLYWYSHWSGRDGSGVRMVSWERDRLGMLKAFRLLDSGWLPRPVDVRVPQTVSCPNQVLEGGKVRVYVNASHLGEYSQLSVSLLDEGFQPISGYSGADAGIISQSGFRTPVGWKRGDALLPSHGPVRLHIGFEGIRPEDCHLHAVYLVGEE